MKNILRLTFFVGFVFCCAVNALAQTEAVYDTLTVEKLAFKDEGGFSNFTTKPGTTKAVYAGDVQGSSDAIEGGVIRMENRNKLGGVIVTKSIGTVKSITFQLASTYRNQSIQVYAKNTPYDSTKNLYKASDIATLGCEKKEVSYAFSDAYDYSYVACKVEGSAHIDVKRIIIEWAVPSDDKRKSPNLSFGCTEAAAIIDVPFGAPTLVKPDDIAGEAIKYTSSDNSVAEVGSDGAVTIKAQGETRITATFEGDETYKSDEVSYLLTVQNGQFAFSAAEYTATLGAINNLPVLTNNYGVNATWQSSDPNVAEVTADGGGNFTHLR